MDRAILISVIILAAIAAIEIFCLFCCSRLRMKRHPIDAVVPVFSGDKNFTDSLDYFGEMLSQSTCCIDRLILIDYGAAPQQLEMCRSFCGMFPAALLVRPEELEDILCELYGNADG